jgi:hypothetical protein
VTERIGELRQPTIAVPIRLAVVGAEAAPAELFVPDVPRPGRSQLLDDLAAMLDDEPAFLPVRRTAGLHLLGKHAIAWIAVTRRETTRPIPIWARASERAGGSINAEMWPDEPSEVTTLYDRMHHVELAMIGGGRLIGRLLDSLPADRPRTIDHLNRAGRFVRLWTQDEHFLVNKTQIAWVAEV